MKPRCKGSGDGPITEAKLKIHWCGDYASACLEMNELIASRYPGDPDILDSLTIKVVPCKGSGVKGRVLAAWPRVEGATTDNVLMVYFGDEPPPAVSA